MKSKKFSIRIPKPCTEDWSTMTPTEKGKFCSSCQKEVIDFTDKLDSEIAKIMSKNKHGLCGRFRTSQLQQVYTYKAIEPEKKSQFKYAAALALSVFTMKNVHAQSNKTTQEIISIEKSDSLLQSEIKTDDDTITLAISTIAKSTNKLLPNTKILISSQTKGYTIANTADSTGKLIINLPKADFPLIIVANARNFLPASLTLDSINQNANLYFDELPYTILTGEPAINEEFDIKDIYYDFNETKIRKESESELNKILDILSEHPDAILEIFAHTDSRGTSQTNLKISQKRAEEIKEWFVKKGIKKSKLKAIGLGENNLINACIDNVECTEYEHQRNRRIEFRIKGKNINIESIERFDMPVEPCRNCEF